MQSIACYSHSRMQFTQLVSGEEFSTVSYVVPALNLHLEEFKHNPEVSEAAQVLKREFKKRFKKFTDPGDDNHVPLFLLATALDPRYCLLLNPNQLSHAKKELLKRLKEQAADKDKNGSTCSSTCEGEYSPNDISTKAVEEPPVKRFHHLDRLLKQKWQEGVKKTASLPPGKAQFERYFQSVVTLGDHVDPLAFWVDREQSYPQLAVIAIDILAIPPVERGFFNGRGGHSW